MSLKSLISNTYNRLRDTNSVLNDGSHRSESPLTPDLPPSATQKRNAAPACGRSPVDFDLAEALRLRALGWSYRRIARQMNNVSRETVRTRILHYEAQFRVATPEPIPAPGPSTEPPIVPVQEPKPAPMSVPVVAPPPEPKAAPVSKIEPVSVAPVAPPEPDSNYDALVEYWAMRGLKNYKPDTRWFFLVHGQQNLQYATGLEQLAVSIDRWYEAYHDLEVFRDAERIWVVIDRRDDNREFVRSLVNDIWIRERCVISVGYVSFERWIQTVMRDRMHRMWDVSPRKWESYDSSQFEAAQHFVSLPQPNHVQRIEELLVPPPEPEKIIPDGGGYSTYGAPYAGCPPQATFDVPQSGDEGCGFAF